MDEAILYLIEFAEKIGPNNVLVIGGIILFVIFPTLLYLSIVLESYARSSSLIEAIQYGKYEVSVTEKGQIEEKHFKVSAWNKVNAVEKVAKKQTHKQNLTFSAKKV